MLRSIIISVLLVSSSAVIGAEPMSQPSSNVYVRLYQTRLEYALGEVSKRTQELKYELIQLKRYEHLYQRKASSAAEFETAQRSAKVAELTLQNAKVQADEAKVMLDIAIERVALGLEMPICPNSLQ